MILDMTNKAIEARRSRLAQSASSSPPASPSAVATAAATAPQFDDRRWSVFEIVEFDGLHSGAHPWRKGKAAQSNANGEGSLKPTTCQHTNQEQMHQNIANATKTCVMQNQHHQNSPASPSAAVTAAATATARSSMVRIRNR